MPRPEPTWGSPVRLPFGDAYVARLATEHRRLEHLLAETEHQLGERQRLLGAALAERNLMRLDVGGFVVRRVGRGRIEIL